MPEEVFGGVVERVGQLDAQLVEGDLGGRVEPGGAALTTQDGITGWWTSRATVPGAGMGEVLKMSFPDAPFTWDMRIDKVDPPALVEWDCVGGPPGWDATRVAWGVEATDTGVVVRLDHTGFPALDDMFRIVTVGWAQMLLSLKTYLETGVRKPFFNF